MEEMCTLEKVQARIEVTLQTSSSTLSLSQEDHSQPFQVINSLRIAWSSQPGRPITFCTHLTAFCVNDPVFSYGAYRRKLFNTSDSNRDISTSSCRHNFICYTEPNMKDREHHEFLTIPGDGSELILAHDLPWSQILKYSHLSKGDLKPGECYRIGMTNAWVRTSWWTWGDANGDLKERKFGVWERGSELEELEERRPPKAMEELETDGWVLAEPNETLEFVDKTDEGFAKFCLVE